MACVTASVINNTLFPISPRAGWFMRASACDVPDPSLRISVSTNIPRTLVFCTTSLYGIQIIWSFVLPRNHVWLYRMFTCYKYPAWFIPSIGMILATEHLSLVMSNHKAWRRIWQAHVVLLCALSMARGLNVWIGLCLCIRLNVRLIWKGNSMLLACLDVCNKSWLFLAWKHPFGGCWYCPWTDPNTITIYPQVHDYCACHTACSIEDALTISKVI